MISNSIFNGGNPDSRNIYKKYQKDAQVVHVQGRDGQVNVSVPSISANFASIGMVEPQDISYQIRKFSFVNDFPNFLASDIFTITINGYLSDSGAVRTFTVAMPISQYISGQSSVTRQHFIDIVHSYLKRVIEANCQLISQFDYPEFDIEVDQGVLVQDFAQCCQLIVYNNKCGLAITIKPVGTMIQYFNASTGTVGLRDRTVYFVGFDIRIEPQHADYVRRETFKRFLGLDETFAITMKIPWEEMRLKFNLAADEGPPKPQPDTGYFNTMTEVFASSYNMITNPVQFIYIRTSLNTNFWSSNGNRSDVLEVVPVDQPIGSRVTLSNDQRTYEIKNNQTQTFQLAFTTKEGNHLVFNQDYVLELAFFFTRAPIG